VAYNRCVSEKPRQKLSSVWSLLLLLAAAAVVGVAVLWLLPAQLTRHPSHGMTAADRLKAVNDARTPLIGFAVLLGSVVTVWFTAQTYRLSRQGQVTERYSKAVAHLGDAQMPVRVGGVYALERIGRDSRQDRDTIIYVLGAFVRERSNALRDRQDRAPEDVHAALRVAGRLLPSSTISFDLRGADLRNTDLSAFAAERVLLDDADITDAVPPRRPA
jgi:hypothetical protein